MATIGSLALKLTASVGSFVGGVGKAAKATAGLATKLKDMVSLGGAVKTVLGGIAVGAFLSWAKHALESAVATVKLARSVGATTEGLTTLQREVKSLGGDTDAVGQGLGTLNERLSGVGDEADYAENVLARMGLSMTSLAGMSTDKAFAEIAEAISKMPDPAQRAATATALFGNNATALLPALNQGKAGIDAAAEAAKRLGLSFSTVDGSQIEDANAKLDTMLDVTKGLATQFAVQLAPWILAALDHVQKLGVTGTSVAAAMAAGFKGIVKGVAYFLDAIKAVGLYVGGGLMLAFTTLFYLVSRGLEKLLRLAAKLPDSLGGNAIKGAADSVKDFADSMEGAGQSIADELKTETDKLFDGSKIDAFFDGIVNKANSMGDALNSISKKTAGGATQIAQRFAKLFAEGAKVFTENQTPAEKFGQELQKLNLLLQSGAISWDTYARATGKAVSELEKAHGLQQVHLPAGLTRNSAAAVSAVNQQDALNERRLRESPQQRLERILEQSAEVERQQLDYLRQVAEAVKRQPVPVRI